MMKVVAWLVLIFVVLLALRMINLRKARARRAEAAPAAADAQPMVRCVRCGIFLPRSDASPTAGGFACADRDCVKS